MKQSIEIKKSLLACGLKPNVKGFSYCTGVVAYCLNNGLDLKGAYESVATTHSVKPNSVEKSISNAVERGFLSIDVQNTFEKMTDDNAKLTNKKFVKYILDLLKE
jgi:hypothetical protein